LCCSGARTTEATQLDAGLGSRQAREGRLTQARFEHVAGGELEAQCLHMLILKKLNSRAGILCAADEAGHRSDDLHQWEIKMEHWAARYVRG